MLKFETVNITAAVNKGCWRHSLIRPHVETVGVVHRQDGGEQVIAIQLNVLTVWLLQCLQICYMGPEGADAILTADYIYAEPSVSHENNV